MTQPPTPPGPPHPPRPPQGPPPPGPPAPAHGQQPQYAQYPQQYQQPYAPAPHPGSAGGQGRRKRKGRLKLWVSLAASVLVLSAAAALLLPRILGSAETDTDNPYAIGDLPERPVTSWRIDYAFGSDNTDYHSQMYDLGGGEALLFSYALDPGGESGTYVEQPMTTSLTRIEVENGDHLWQVDLVEAIAWLPSAQQSVWVRASDDSDIIGVGWTDYGWGDGERSTTYIATLDADSGEVHSELEMDHEYDGPYHPLFDGDSVYLLLQTYQEERDYPLAMRLDARNLDQIEWTSEATATVAADYPGLIDAGPHGTVIQHGGVLSGSDQHLPYYLDTETGEIIDSLSEQDSVHFQGLGPVILEHRYRSGGGATELRAFDAEQVAQWDRPRSADRIWSPNGTLLVADTSETSMSLNRLDPATGEQTWDQALGTSSAEVHSASDAENIYLISRDGRFAVHDAATGDEKFYGQLDPEQEYFDYEGSGAGFGVSFHPGDQNLYIRGINELVAYSWDEGSQVWHWQYNPQNESVVQVGERLLLHEHHSQTWSLLE
ncbi:outer membrane protein assembly factor BamB family protein [Nesterenkonia ebinurensis]|uniref:outer membrane protein assembly factor BamB family protein n=1 Tax=Nesterenkonia ebinurensis TaxID=2608252 RepID=UPI00123E1908|nr:PQQ-binding-like beta-propeller repeat protein [Nesterenkonia ebinurensis]